MNDHRVPPELEEQLSELLKAEEQGRNDPGEEARQKLPPRYEVRVRAELDPIAEETRKVREIAEEIDDRYDRYH